MAYLITSEEHLEISVELKDVDNKLKAPVPSFTIENGDQGLTLEMDMKYLDATIDLLQRAKQIVEARHESK